MDYRIRAYLTDVPHRNETITRASRFLNSLEGIGQDGVFLKNKWSQSRGTIAENLFASLAERLQTLKATRRLLPLRDEEIVCRYCALLAHLDFVGRSPLHSPSTKRLLEIANRDVEAMLAAIEPEIVFDIMAMSIRFYYRNEKLLSTFSNLVIAGTCSGSADVGGADFDAVIDNILFDFKTTLKPRIKTEFLRQLIGYWLLDYEDEFKIKAAAVYLARQGYTVTLDFENDLLRSNRAASKIRESFRKRIQSNSAQLKSRKLKANHATQL